MNLAGETVLVTGATGLIGSGLCRRLLDEGARVTGLARSPERAAELAAQGVKIVKADLSKNDPIESAVWDCSVVFHCAGVMAPDFHKPWSYFRQVNVEGTRRVAEAALSAGVQRFLHVSTAWVYGFDAGPGTTEASPRHPSGDPYCDTKLEGETVVRELARDRGLPAIIVQPTEIYGPGDQAWTGTPIRLIKASRMVLPNRGAGIIQPIFSDDAIDGVVAAAKHGEIGDDYILCGSVPVTCGELFGAYAQMLGKPELRSVPGWFAYGLALAMRAGSRVTGRPPMLNRTAVRGVCLRTTYSGEKARQKLGFEPKTDLATGLGAVQAWLEETGQLG